MGCHLHPLDAVGLPGKNDLMKTEIAASRVKLILLFLVSLGFVATGLLVPRAVDRGLGWGTWFFALGAFVFFVQLVRPARLVLDQEGLNVTGGLRHAPMRIAWRDVSRFFVVPIRPGVSMIGFDYASDTVNKPRGTMIARGIVGADGGFPGSWSGGNAAVAERLNAYRHRALETSGAY